MKMLALMAAHLQAINYVLLGAGVVGLLGWLVHLRRQGRWRNPLAGVPVPSQGPDLSALLLVLLAYCVLVSLLMMYDPLGSGRPPGAAPGSAAWHRLQAGETSARLLVSLFMLLLLRSTWPRRRLRDDLRTTPAALCAVLVFLPMAELQVQMGQVLWTWLRPDVQPPMHIVLVSLRESRWEELGAAQLTLGAVVVAPLSEELFFRGVLLQALCLHLGRAWPAVLISAGCFGLVHAAQPQDVLPLLSMGVVLAYLRVRTGSLWPCVLVHVLFNARTMATVLLAPELLQTTG